MKRFLSILLLLFALSFTLVGCGGNEDPADGPSNTPADGSEEGKEEAPKEITYTITWMDENGALIASETVKENTVPSRSYSVTDTAEWDYKFLGWASTATGGALPTLPKATGDATYYAKVNAVKQKYTVKFNTQGGSLIDSVTVEYGDTVSAPKAPEYEGHKFMGWATAPDGETVDFEKAITGNVEYFAIWNEVLDVKALLSTLLNGYELNPLSYIPESMLSDYSDNLVDADSVLLDYTSSVSIADINYGHGEQWHAVLDNLAQTKVFFNVLSVVEALSTTSITAFNNYFDENPADTASFTFESGIYNVTIDFDGETILYVLDYTAELPVLGEQTVQIALSMVKDSGERVVRIQLGDANAIRYTATENSYEFAIKYLGVRRAMFSVSRDSNDNVSGKVYEYLTVSSVEIASTMEFYITEDYVSVVGNKADGMLGFTGYINELYDAESGKMLGYEVQETLSEITYNTLWFNLSDVFGINSIKYREANGSTKAAFFVNGSSDEWAAKKVGGISAKMLSRRFDIEFRVQYVYSYDPVTEEYTEHKVEVPMLFVQEENFDTLIADVGSTNGIIIALLVNSDDISKILSDYDTLIPAYIENKELITVDLILAYIGEKIVIE